MAPVLGAVEAVEAGEVEVSGEIAVTLSPTALLVFGVIEAMNVGEDGISEIVVTKRSGEELPLELRKEVIVDIAARTFSFFLNYLKRLEHISPLPVEIVFRSCSPS